MELVRLHSNQPMITKNCHLERWPIRSDQDTTNFWISQSEIVVLENTAKTHYICGEFLFRNTNDKMDNLGKMGYIAAVLDQKSQSLLTSLAVESVPSEFVFKTKAGMLLPHHMTINLGDLDTKLNPSEILGQKVFLEISKIVYNLDLGVCASPVINARLINGNEINSSNLIPHITIGLLSHGKPKDSNMMLEKDENNQVIKLEFPIILESIVSKVDQ